MLNLTAFDFYVCSRIKTQSISVNTAGMTGDPRSREGLVLAVSVLLQPCAIFRNVLRPVKGNLLPVSIYFLPILEETLSQTCQTLDKANLAPTDQIKRLLKRNKSDKKH